ncbi:MAG: rhodanese-like domain-containing protein [Chlorobiota bacterium]|jgi:rhodanese-related sulfurtransferase|nr:MAG: rhodanese-like domain-containing protein [Chlorobiota bacterium]
MLKSLLSHTVREVTVSQLEKSNDVILLDSREKKEYDVSHLKNSIWVGYSDFNLERLKGIDKSSKIVVYCSVGYRSEKISEKLLSNNYTNVSNLYGGIFEWVNNNSPIYDLNNKSTKKIHAYDHIWGLWLKKGEKIF